MSTQVIARRTGLFFIGLDVKSNPVFVRADTGFFMDKPQLENGYLKISNEVWEALGRYRISGEEWLVLNCVIRKTYGFNKKSDYISLSQFQGYTGLKRPNVIRSLKKLVAKKLLGSSQKATRDMHLYWFNKLFKEWVPSIKKDTTPKGSINKDNKVVAKKIIGVVAKKIHTKDNITKDIITKDNTTNVVKQSFGKEEINEVSAYFLEQMKIPTEDCTKQQSRRYWYHLLRESKTGVSGVKWLIDQAAADEFLRNNITSSKDLYYKRIKIISRKRGSGPKIAVFGGGNSE